MQSTRFKTSLVVSVAAIAFVIALALMSNDLFNWRLFAQSYNNTGRLTVRVNLEGRTNPVPHISWVTGMRAQLRTLNGIPVVTGTFTTNAGGQFFMSGIPVPPTGTSATYNLWVKGVHTLSRMQQITIDSAENSVAIRPLLFEGDADDNNIVNILDFSLLAVSFGKTLGENGFNVATDFDQNSIVNILDFSLLASHFGQTGTS